VTQHLLTNLETAAAFTGMRYEVSGSIGEPCSTMLHGEPGEVRLLPPSGQG
jgi:hypothetical protein